MKQYKVVKFIPSSFENIKEWDIKLEEIVNNFSSNGWKVFSMFPLLPPSSALVGARDEMIVITFEREI